ncbi:MAG: Lrp/AsnC family transcriptional regulator [Nanoarchaeota archaeon]|nr:Lrp/AsnC family transcriptional regulator [Nanoarchaeota archaeon]
MLKETDLQLLTHLRKDGRKKVTEISRELNIPVTTLYDRLDALKKQVAMNHTTLVDFKKLGYQSVVHLGFKVGIDNRESFERFLADQPALNSLYKVNHDFDFLVNMIFRDAGELKDFLEEARSRFRIDDIKIFDVVDEVKKEKFLSQK